MGFRAVFLGATRLDGPAQPDTQIARALSATHEVLFVEPPTFLHEQLRRGHRPGRSPRVVEERSGLHALRPVASPGADRPQLAAIGDQVIAWQVRRAIDAALPGPEPLVVIACYPLRGELPSLGADLLVYCQQDRVPSDPSLAHPEHLVARHRALVAAADLVTGVADDLVDEARRDGAHEAMLLPNGAEVERFATPATRPPELKGQQTVVGFAGGVTERLDYELLVAVAEAEPDWLVALVGATTVEVPSRPNLVAFGARPYEAMPAWCQAFTVGVIPYWTNDFNRASFPLKTYEYLAAGSPVVSTTLPMLADLHPYVRFGDDADSFLGAVRAAVHSGPTPEACRALAQPNSWTARAGQLAHRIEELLDDGDRR